MSRMSSVRLTHQKRLSFIKDNITTLTFNEIAKQCGVTKRTIRRDVQEWKNKGGYDSFLLEEFFKLYGVIKIEDPRHAFDRICDLLRRRQDSIKAVDEQVDGYSIEWLEHETKNPDNTVSAP